MLSESAKKIHRNLTDGTASNRRVKRVEKEDDYTVQLSQQATLLEGEYVNNDVKYISSLPSKIT